MTFKAIIYLFLFLLIIPFALANTDYNESGNFNGDYQLGTGIFNQNLNPATDITISVKTVSNPRGIPLVSDLDNDGVNEIIIIDLPLVRLLAPVSLDTVAGFNTGLTERISNVITFDIDDDGLTEIIFVFEESEKLMILRYNGTTFINQTSILLTTLASTTDSEFMIKCGKPNNCLMVWNEDIDDPASTHFSIIPFNSTAIGSHQIVIDNAGGNVIHCFPKIRSISYEDYNGDGNRYIFSSMRFEAGQFERLFLEYIDVSDNLTLTQEHEIQANSCGLGRNIFPFTGGLSTLGCNEPEFLLGNFYTSPLVFDIEDESDGLETVVGVAVNDEEFVMCSYFNPEISTSLMDDFPEVVNADGLLLSNPFRANIIIGIGGDTSGGNDFCVLGYHDENEELEMLCAQTRGINLIADKEYKFSTAGRINITVDTYRSQSILAHSAQHSTATTDGINLNEIVTSYGIFSVDPDTIFEFQGLIPIRTLNLIFDNPKDSTIGKDGSMISVDAEKLNIEGGSEDLIFMNSNNIYYFDDGRTNLPATITHYEIDPCVDSTWKINTTVEVLITVTDPDDDFVSAKAILYEGSSNEIDSGWSNNVSSGTEIPFNFIANKTFGTGNLILKGRDVENLATEDVIELTFGVGANGVEFGDCKTIVDIIPVVDDDDEEVTEATLTEDATENAITNALGTFEGLTGLAGTTVWLIFMLLGAFFIYSIMAERGLSGSSALGTIAIVEVLAIILGARLGIFSTGLVVTIVVIGVVIIGIFLGKIFRGDSAAAE